MSVRVRLAPSPTGNLHIGTARTAVFNWLFARHQKGKFILRIEDTDLERSRPEYTENILEGLSWLGLEWDEGPYYQSQRLELYQKATQSLLDKGLAYRCYCTEAELEQMREAQKARKEAARYDNRHRKLTPEQQAAFEAEGRQAVIRFKIEDDQVITWNDMVRGTVTWKGSDLGGDLVISRAAAGGKVGQPLYNMAVVVDDMDMKISHIIRGEDHIANTAKQILLYEALEGKIPEFGHTPLILNAEGRKLSKRDGVSSIYDFKELGFIPEALANYMCLLGWTPPDSTKEIFTLPEAATEYSFDRVNKAGGKFDWDKLDWINSQYLHNISVEELTDRLIPIWEKAGYEFSPEGDRSWLEQLAALIGPSLIRLTDAVEMSKLFFSATIDMDEEAVTQMQKEDSVNSVNSILEMIDADVPLGVGDAQEIIKRVTQRIKVKRGIVMRSLRASLTGAMQGPDLIQSWLLLHQRGFDIVRFKKAINQEIEETKKVETTTKDTVVVKTATPESTPSSKDQTKTKTSPAATTPTAESKTVSPATEKKTPATTTPVAATTSMESKTVSPATEKKTPSTTTPVAATPTAESKTPGTIAPAANTPTAESKTLPPITEKKTPSTTVTPAATSVESQEAQSTTEKKSPSTSVPVAATPIEQQAQALVETPILDEQQPGDTETKGTIDIERLEKNKEQVINIFSNFPDYISQFYQEYQSQFKVVGLLILTILTVRLIIGFLEVLEEIPVLSISFEFIGVGYSVWFVYRYLLRKSNRQELLDKIQEIKTEITGKES